MEFYHCVNALQSTSTFLLSDVKTNVKTRHKREGSSWKQAVKWVYSSLEVTRQDILLRRCDTLTHFTQSVKDDTTNQNRGYISDILLYRIMYIWWFDLSWLGHYRTCARILLSSQSVLQERKEAMERWVEGNLVHRSASLPSKFLRSLLFSSKFVLLTESA